VIFEDDAVSDDEFLAEKKRKKTKQPDATVDLKRQILEGRNTNRFDEFDDSFDEDDESNSD
jgi:hypothetical protein